MVESITKRVGRIMSGSINAIIDAMENAAPEAVMEQAIREIDSAIDDVRNNLGKVIASKHLANKRMSEKNAQHETLYEKIDIAISEKRDDLAEAAIAKQLDIEAQIPVLENTISENSEREKELEGYITALRAKKREMKSELKTYRETKTNAVATGNNASTNQGNVDKTIDQASAAFDRILEKQTGLGSMSTSSAQGAEKLAELEKMSQKNRIKERLAALKSNHKEQQAGHVDA